MSTPVRFGNISEFQKTRIQSIDVDGTTVAIFKIANKFYAVQDHCPHAGYTLHDGEVEGTTMFCLLHGPQFDLTDGKWVGGLPCDDTPRQYGNRIHFPRNDGMIVASVSSEGNAGHDGQQGDRSESVKIVNFVGDMDGNDYKAS